MLASVDLLDLERVDIRLFSWFARLGWSPLQAPADAKTERIRALWPALLGLYLPRLAIRPGRAFEEVET
jgi:hypothetical protein